MIVTDSCGSLTQGKAKIGRFQPTVSQKAIETIVKKYKPYIKDDPTKIITGALGSSPSKKNSSGTKPTTAAAPNAQPIRKFQIKRKRNISDVEDARMHSPQSSANILTREVKSTRNTSEIGKDLGNAVLKAATTIYNEALKVAKARNSSLDGRQTLESFTLQKQFRETRNSKIIKSRVHRATTGLGMQTVAQLNPKSVRESIDTMQHDGVNSVGSKTI